MTKVPVWVKFPNLPLKCWSTKCLSKITSMPGKPIQSDKLASTMSRLSYAKVLVELDLLDDLSNSIEIVLPNGTTLRQLVVYETLPKFYKHCRVLCHTTGVCSKAAVPDEFRMMSSHANGSKGYSKQDSVFYRLGPITNIHLETEMEKTVAEEQIFDPMQAEFKGIIDEQEM